MASYEIRKYVGGRWLLDSVFDDKETAVGEAKTLIERSRAIPAIRVVAVTDDENGFREWTVFKQSIVDDENEQAMQREYQAKRELDTARAQRRSERARRKATPRERPRPSSRYSAIAVRALVVAGIGIAALILLWRLFP